MAKNDEKKTALKLINKYAESYNILEDENKSLRTEIKDLRANLKINKEIIEGFFNTGSKNDKNSMYINKLKEEMKRLELQTDKALKERDEARVKLNYLEQTTTEAINREKEEKEKYQNKLFVMDNALIKKDAIIAGLRKKLDKNGDDDRYSNYYEREIFVIEPTVAVTQIHDELLLYKQIYDNLALHIKEKSESLIKYETIVNELQNENAKLRTQMKLNTLSANREKEDLQRERERSKSASNLNPDNNKKNHPYNTATYNKNNEMQIPVDLNKLKNKLKMGEDIYNPDKGTGVSNTGINLNKNDEWIEILRLSGLTPEELDRMARNKMLARIMDAIEMMNRLLCDKNLQIRLLEQENENLNQKNYSLNKDNIQLFHQCVDLKKELQKYVNINTHPVNKNMIDGDSSMVNNTSSITINNLNINKISNKDKSKNLKQELNGVSVASSTMSNIKGSSKQSNYNDPTANETGNYREEISYHEQDGEGDIDNDNEVEVEADSNSTVEYVRNAKNKTKNKLQSRSNTPNCQNTAKNNTNQNYNNNINKMSKSNSGEESSGHDSIIYTKDINNGINSGVNAEINSAIKAGLDLNMLKKNNPKFDPKNIKDPQQAMLNTLESCTLSEFKDGLAINEQSFLSQANDIENLNIDIRQSNS